jgi:hypothetical protein
LRPRDPRAALSPVRSIFTLDRRRCYNPVMADAPRTGARQMNVEELKSLLEKARAQSKDNNGKVMMCSERGPVGFDLVQHLITVVEQQQHEIDALKAKFIT